MAQQQNTYLLALEAKDTSFIVQHQNDFCWVLEKTFATACIAGTIKTGQTPEETKNLEHNFYKTAKYREHQIVGGTFSERVGEDDDLKTVFKHPLFWKIEMYNIFMCQSRVNVNREFALESVMYTQRQL